MAITELEILSADLVLVGFEMLKDAGDVERFGDAVKTEVVLSGGGFLVGTPNSAPEASRQLSLNRDRIVLDIAPS